MLFSCYHNLCVYQDKVNPNFIKTFTNQSNKWMAFFVSDTNPRNSWTHSHIRMIIYLRNSFPSKNQSPSKYILLDEHILLLRCQSNSFVFVSYLFITSTYVTLHLTGCKSFFINESRFSCSNFMILTSRNPLYNHLKLFASSV